MNKALETVDGMDFRPAASFAVCRAITRRHARSFYFSSFVLDPAKRRAAYAVYAFCRHCDDRVDEGGLDRTGDMAAAKAALQADLQNALAGRGFGWAPAFSQTIARYGIPRRFLDDLIHGVCLDVTTVRIADWPELKDYCYYVAGVVGLIMSRIFGLKDLSAETQAVEMGTAMQLTNICRDVGEDLDRGRIYLPATELAQFGLTKHDLSRRQVTPEFRRLMQFQLQRARDHYRRAEPGILLIDDSSARACARVMSRVYGGIHEEIERLDYDVFHHRAHTSFPRKLRLALDGLATSGG